MRNTRISSLALLALILTSAGAVFAHHGTANYDTNKSITIKGAVTDFQFINPHVLIALDVKDDKGKVVNWQGALTSPNRLARTGWTKDSLKTGEVITLSGFPTKSGSPEIWIQKVFRADGTELVTDGGN